MNERTIEDFVRESNLIEGIVRREVGGALNPQFEREVLVTQLFLRLTCVTVLDLENFVAAVQPGAVLRRRVGCNVRIGSHVPPSGGPGIEPALRDLLAGLKHSGKSAFATHLAYEALHPFTDGNGRSGRVLWLRQMGGRAPLGFLHQFYYQTLAERQS